MSIEAEAERPADRALMTPWFPRRLRRPLRKLAIRTRLRSSTESTLPAVWLALLVALAFAILIALLALATPAAAKPVHTRATKEDCRPQDLAGLSSWSGVWIAEHLETALNGRDVPGAALGTSINWPVYYKLAGWTAPWNDEGWSRFEAMIGQVRDGLKQNGGFGFPAMMSSPAPFKFIIAPAETAIISEYLDVRYVYTDGRGHPPAGDVWPTVWGDSIGCWKGRTLVIETTNVKYSPEFNAFAAPLSDEARYVERLRLVAPGRLQSDIVVTDPVTMEKPWRLTMTYVRPKGIDRLVHDGDMLDNDRSVMTEGSGTIMPPRERAPWPPPPGPADAKLTQTELDRIAGDYAIDGAPMKLKIDRRGGKLLFEVDPAQPFWLPLHARGPLDFEAMNLPFHFTADAAGQVAGFSSKSPDGAPISGKRLKETDR
jgi:hypothetical protein